MKLKNGYQRADVGVIPEDWTVKKLQDISPQQSVGLVINPSTYFDKNGSVPMLVGSNVSENSINWNSAKRITTESNEKLPASRLHAGDLVMVRVGAPGITAVIPPEFDQSNCASMMIIRQDESFSSNWLCYMMNSPKGKQQVESVQYGTAQKQFNISDAINFKYPFPPLPEQQAIATALSDIDALIDGLSKLITKKRDIKQATMQQLLTSKTRLPGFSGKWKGTVLGEIAKIQRGASPRPIDNPIWFTENSSVGWVRISDVTNANMFLLETTQQLSPLGVKNSRPVASGSLVMSICATVGRPIITKIDVCIHDGFVVFDLLKADQLFIYYFLKWIEPNWSEQGQTGSQMNLNTALINNTKIKLPPLDEQTAIAQVLSDMDNEIATLEKRLEKTRMLKQGMMQELLTGRIRLV